MEALHGSHWSEIDPSDSEMSLGPCKHVWAHDWHFLDSYIASPNDPNRGYKPPLTSHPSLPPTPPPSQLPTPLYVPLVILKWLQKVA